MDKLIKIQIFQEITEHLKQDNKPSEFLTSISEDRKYSEYPLTMLWRLKATEQSKKYHPEGSVWNHTMLVLDEAAVVRNRAKDIDAFMWAALLHDIGKPGTTSVRNGKITSYDHDKEGEKLSYEFLRLFTGDRVFIEKVAALVRYHMHMLYVLKDLPYKDVKGLLERVEVEDLALLCRCDRIGRLGADFSAEESGYMEFLGRLKGYHV